MNPVVQNKLETILDEQIDNRRVHGNSLHKEFDNKLPQNIDYLDSNDRQPTNNMETVLKDSADLHYKDAMEREAFDTYVKQLRTTADKIGPITEENLYSNELNRSNKRIKEIDNAYDKATEDLQDNFEIEEADDLLPGIKIMPKKVKGYDDNVEGRREVSNFINSNGDNQTLTDYHDSTHLDGYNNRLPNKSRERVDTFELYLNRLRSRSANKDMNWKDGTKNDFVDDHQPSDMEDMNSTPDLEDVLPDDMEEDLNEVIPDEKSIFDQDIEPVLVDEISSVEETEDNREHLNVPNNRSSSSEDIEPIELHDNTEEEEVPTEETHVETENDEQNEDIYVEEIEDLNTQVPKTEPTEKARIDMKSFELTNTPEPFQITPSFRNKLYPYRNSFNSQTTSYRSRYSRETARPKTEFQSQANEKYEYSGRIQSETVPNMQASSLPQENILNQYPLNIYQSPYNFPGYFPPMNPYWPPNYQPIYNVRGPPSTKKPPEGTPPQNPPIPFVNPWLTVYANPDQSIYNGPGPPSTKKSPEGTPPQNSPIPFVNPWLAAYANPYQPIYNFPGPSSTKKPPEGTPPQNLPIPFVNPWLAAYANPWMYGYYWGTGYLPCIPNTHLYGIPPSLHPFPEKGAPNTPSTINERGTTGFFWPTKRKTPRMTVYTTVPENNKEYKERLCSSFDEYVKQAKSFAEKKKEEMMNRQTETVHH